MVVFVVMSTTLFPMRSYLSIIMTILRYYGLKLDLFASREGSSIIIRIVYHPPSSNAPATNEYLSCQLSAFESSFPNTGTVLLGDLNKLNDSGFSRHFRLKQLVNFPTRGNNTLDLILTDLKEYYSTPEKLSSFGLSDHLTILLKPKTRRTSQERRIIRKIRDLRSSKEQPSVPLLTKSTGQFAIKAKAVQTNLLPSKLLFVPVWTFCFLWKV